MSTLFNLDQFTTQPQIKSVSDPYWDLPEEVILSSCSGKVEDNGQTTLFYDSSDEPPSPEDYPDQESYDRAWGDWEKLHPDFKPDMTFPEQEEEEFMDDVLEELPKPKPIEFVEDGIYWHEGRQLKAKIIKIYKSVGKADVYWAGDIFKERIYLSELSTLPEQPSPTCETTTQQESEVINSGQCQPVKLSQQQADDVLEKPAINQWVEPYYVNRSGKKYWYDRYCYYLKRIKHIHIGNKPDLKEAVEKAIALGKLPHEIENLIRGVA